MLSGGVLLSPQVFLPPALCLPQWAGLEAKAGADNRYVRGGSPRPLLVSHPPLLQREMHPDGYFCAPQAPLSLGLAPLQARPEQAAAWTTPGGAPGGIRVGLEGFCPRLF